MNYEMKGMLATALILCGLSAFFTSCGSGKGSSADRISFVAGTLEEPLPADAAPSQISEAFANAERFHPYDVMSDSANAIHVAAISDVDTTPTDGHGFVVTKGAVSTTFVDLCNARAPMAAYDKDNDVLWLSCSAMWGTGVQVDRLYQIRFDENDSAYIANTIDPYILQQQLCQRLGYSIDGQEITLWDGERKIATATNTLTDMGGFDDEHPVWIGEQITYDLTGAAPRLIVTPGVKFIVGLVLTYDDMPTLAAPITIVDDRTVTIGDIDEYK